jgi:hypothetical protein
MGQKKVRFYSDSVKYLQTCYKNIVRDCGIKADGSAIYFQYTLTPILRANYICFDSWIESHGGHTGTDLSIPRYLADFDPAGSCPL